MDKQTNLAGEIKLTKRVSAGIIATIALSLQAEYRPHSIHENRPQNRPDAMKESYKELRLA